MIRRRRPGRIRGLLLLCASALALLQTAAAHATPEFSPQVIPLETLCYMMWKPLWTDLPRNILDKFTPRIAPDGSAIYYSGPDSEQYAVQVHSSVNTDRTQRYVSFEFIQPGGSGFLIEVKTTGTELVAPPVSEVLRGKIPYYPSAPNETWSELSLSDSGYRFWFVTSKRTEGDKTEIAMDSYSSSSGPLLSYRELATPSYREITYTLYSTKPGNDLVFVARKTQSLDMFIGTEEFMVNSKVYGFDQFQDLFKQTILMMVLNFIGFG